MRPWGALLLIAAGGCSTGITAPMDMSAAADLATPVTGDLAAGCTLAFSGDVNMIIACRPFLCHPTSYEDIDLAGPIDNPTYAHASFDVDGAFALRSYTTADFRSVDIGIMGGGIFYRTEKFYGSATLAVSALQEPPSASDPCGGSFAHGTATATLVELDDGDGGVQ